MVTKVRRKYELSSEDGELPLFPSRPITHI